MTFVQGAPSLNNATAALLAYANLTWDDVIPVEVGGYNGSIDAVLNDRADAAGGACNSPPFLRIEASPRGLRWPELPHDDPEAVARVRARLPWYVPHMAVEGPTISGDGIQVFSSAYPFLVALAETDDTLVYSMVKVMLEHFDEYKGNAPGANGWAIDRQKFDHLCALPSRAIRYFKEIGIWSEAAEKTNQANLHRQLVLQDAWQSYLPNAPEGYQAFEEGWLQAREAALETAGLITGVKDCDDRTDAAMTAEESLTDSTAESKAPARYRELSDKWRAVMAIMTALAILLATNQIFNLGFFVGYVMLDSRYMYLITGVMLCMVFITFPGVATAQRTPWYDIAIMVCIGLIFPILLITPNALCWKPGNMRHRVKEFGWRWRLGRSCWKPGVALAGGRCLPLLRCSRCIRHLQILCRLSLLR